VEDAALLKPGPDILERARKVRVVLLDVDGVLTDGRLYMTSDGTEGRAFHVRDGHGIVMARRAGLTFGILSGRTSKVVSDRAAELGIEEVHQGVADKAARFGEILERLRLSPDEVCFVGDDIVDVPVLRRAGLAVAPADADDSALAASHVATTARGGAGVVREVVDLLLRAQGSWERVTERYFRED
jgi:3-deoxy-D-manno-octulosonate 8-phosphate phosphatase (KDO 8-P phosphatase)